MSYPTLLAATFWDSVGLPFLVSLFASIVTVALIWCKEQRRLASDARRYCGVWDQYVIGDGRLLRRDPENCTVHINRVNPWRPDVLRLRARHVSPTGGERVWEGDLVIDRNLHTRAVVAWAYTSPPELSEFGVYNALLHDNGELLITPALPPLAGDYLRFVLRRAPEGSQRSTGPSKHA